MSFDPTYPPTNAEIESAPLRAQFNGLKALIDAVPAGPPGPPGNDGAPGQNGSDGTNGNDGAQGPPGPPFTNFVVDGVTTLNPTDPAAVNLSFDGSQMHFTFGIPRGTEGIQGSSGNDGPQGPPGTPFTNFIVDGVNMLNPTDPASVNVNFDGSAVRLIFNLPRGFTGNDGAAGMPGSNGSDGMQGPPGPPFTNFVVDNVNQLPLRSLPNVSANYDGNAVRLNFGIPQGNDGPQGPTGPQGATFGNTLVDNVATLNPGDNATVQTSFDGYNVHFQFGIPRGFTGNDGGSGPQGPPGEVTTMQLNSAINGTSNNSNAVNTLVMTVSDPPTVGEVQAIASKLDELILALRR